MTEHDEPIQPDPDDVAQPDDDYDFDPPWLNDFLRALARSDGYISKACAAVDIDDEDRVYYQMRHQPAFARTVEHVRWQARQPFIHRIEDQIFQLADSGDIEHIRAIVTAGQPPERIKITRRMNQLLQLLERIAPERWAPKPPPPQLGAGNVSFTFAMSDHEPEAIAEDAEWTETPALPPGKETPDA